MTSFVCLQNMMRRIALCALFMCHVWHTQGARILNSRGQRLDASAEEPRDTIVHAGCGKTDTERAVGQMLQKQAQATTWKVKGLANPFAVCGADDMAGSVKEVADKTMKFCALGKLAKNGNFFASADATILAKRIEDLERKQLGYWDEFLASEETSGVYPGGCEKFADTYLVPMLTTFEFDSSPYVVMPNLTHYLAQADPDNWEVTAVYDAKPLPNLGEGLVKLVKGLSNEWGKDKRKMSEWESWQKVRNQLTKDLEFLKHPQLSVVDYSLFAHVIQRKDGQHVPEEFSASKGCIIAPSRDTVVCFQILDYLTPLTWKRELESEYKASKFGDYAEKFLMAFDCIGDIRRNDCENYKALASITAAMDVSKAMAKAVFIGVEAFPAAYQCTNTEPQFLVGGGVEFNEVPSPFEYAIDNYDARALQKVASSESGTQYIRNFCSGTKTDKDCVQAILKSEQPRDEPALAKHVDMERCVQMINEFATESYTSKGHPDAAMHNVLWNSEQSALIAVRGLPKMKFINYTQYMHKDAMARGRGSNCFMKMHYLRCTPNERQGVYFNYKQHFGELEVMMLYGNEYSSDLAAFAKANK